MSLKDVIKGRVEDFDHMARPWAGRSKFNAFAYEFLLFGLKQAWACLFGGAMVGLLIVTHFTWPATTSSSSPPWFSRSPCWPPGWSVGTRLW